jgi:hypothetical protein
VARIETAMWRAYYERHPVELLRLLAELLRRQYGFPFWRSWLGAWHAASAAVTFQEGASRSDYERALPDLRSFYGLIRRGSDVDFDGDRVARRELEWWIAHRERRPDLASTLADLQAELYRAPAERFAAHAEPRARAMLFRDGRGAAITEADWRRIEVWLLESWSSLHREVSGAR